MFDYIKEPIRIKAEIFNPKKLKEYNEMGAKIERIPTAIWTKYILPIYVENIFIRNYIIEDGDYIIMEWKNFYACNQLEFEKDHRWFGEKEELQEQKKNLIRADKKKTEYIDELEEKLKLTENDRDEREVKARDLMKKLKEIEKAYIGFEKAETEYNKKLWVLDKLIMIR